MVRKNVEGTKEYVQLRTTWARWREGAPQRDSQRGRPRYHLETDRSPLHEVGEYADGFGVEIRVEVHGAITQLVPNLAKIIRYADHPNVYVCWNSNPTDVVNGSIRENFDLVAPKIREVHLRDLFDEAYPWTELFALLKAQKYEGFYLS